MQPSPSKARVLWVILAVITALSVVLSSTGCANSPIHGNFVSNEKNIWLEDPSGSGLTYCISNHEGTQANPVCYPARRAPAGEVPHSSAPQGR